MNITPTSSSATFSTSSQPLQETALERRIGAELHELRRIRSLIHGEALPNQFIQSIQNWNQRFQTSLEGLRGQSLAMPPILEAYSRELQDLLRTVTTPHPLISPLVAWLQLHHADVPSNLPSIQPPPDQPAPTDRIGRFRLIQQMQRERAAVPASLNEILIHSEQRMRTTLRAAEAVQQGVFQGVAQRIENSSQQDREEIQEVRQEVEEQSRQLDALSQQVDELAISALQLRGDLNHTSEQIKQLHIAIDDCRRQIKEQGSGVGIFKAIGVIGACLFATWALQGVLAAAGITTQAAVLPVSGGGAKGALSFGL